METTILDFHNDMLDNILSHLNIDQLKAASTVCKKFCSISRARVRKLAVTDPSSSYQDILNVLRRFSRATEIRINCARKLDVTLLAISNSDYLLTNLEKLQVSFPKYQEDEFLRPRAIEKMSTSEVIRSIKSLKLIFDEGAAMNHMHFSTELIVEFVHLFSGLTELDISCEGLRNDDVHKITSKLPNLRKINLSSTKRLTNETLAILSSNCTKIQRVNFQFCAFTDEALRAFFSNNTIEMFEMCLSVV